MFVNRQIVANWKSGVDVDKWDYFLRDSHSLGLQVNWQYEKLKLFLFYKTFEKKYLSSILNEKKLLSN